MKVLIHLQQNCIYLLTKINQPMKKIFFSLLLVLTSTILLANPPKGSLKVEVKGTDNEQLVAVSLKILNSPFFAVTDVNGVAVFQNLSVGNYTLNISSVGYSSQNKTVEIVADKTTELSVSLVENTQALDEVVITAQRSESTFEKVPVAVTSLNSKQIQAARVWRFDDMLALAPNFHLSPAGGGYYLMSVRGINSYSKVPAVVSYIDDVPIFNGYIMGYNVQDLESMEFLRGPQGTLFGRGASGGVLNIRTQRPTSITSGFAEISLGNNNQQRYNAGFRTPLVKDKLFFSASGLYTHNNGFFTNTLDGKRVGDNTALGGNVKLSFIPNAKFMFNYDLRGEKSDELGSFTRAANAKEAFDKPYIVNVDQTGNTFRNFLIHSLSMNYFGENFTIKSITSYQDIRLKYENYDLDASPLDYQYYYTPDNQPSKNLTQEIKFSSANDENKRFKWTGGFFFFRSDDLDNISYYTGKAGPPLDFGNGNTVPPPYENITYSTVKANGFAIYGQGSYKITPKTEVHVGLRYDSERSNLTTRSDLKVGNAPSQTVLPSTEAQTSFDAISPKVSVIQFLGEKSSLYASYARGYRPGGVNPYTNDPKFLTFAPEFSNNFELGYKLTTLENRLRLNLTAFQISLRDQQLYTITSGFNFATLNIGDINSRGIESELSLLLARGLQLDWNMGFTKAKYTKLPYFVANTQGIPENKDLTNNVPIQSPVVTSFVALQYSAPISKKMTVSIRGEWKYTGEQYFDYANTIKQAGFSIINTRLAVSYKKTELSFWTRNLADQKYLTYAYPFLLTEAQLSLPRTIGFTLGTRF
jgi:iron complex outermembrane receptor protein